MPKTDEKIILQIIEALKNKDKNNVQVAKDFNVSLSIVERVNNCVTYRHLHNFKHNIRRESNDLLLNCINEYIEKPDYYELKITKTDGSVATCVFDKEDYLLISSLKWSFRYDKQGNPRVKTTSPKYQNKNIWQVIMGDIKGVCDHIDRDPLNNRKINLRDVSPNINSINAKARSNSPTQIRGIYRRDARPGIAAAAWICSYSIDGKRKEKSFSVRKYGEEQAFDMACSLREEKLKELKI